MNEVTFRKLGFKCGLEIHQQLLTETKLFCNCPAGYRNDSPNAEIIRHMRPTLSELGEYDGTALMEFKTKKRVIYQLYRENMCTYEMDDTPPFVINKKALEIGIRLALMLNCAIVDELHVSRKQYLDGSIPTGFQRTAVVGVAGWVPYQGRKIMLSHVCLEEDACREVLDIGHDIVFRTDRLSIPLLEVITRPVLETPQEARLVNELLGRLLKASGLVRRGIGSVRQDVNVSIEGGARVELKGISKTGYVEKMTAIEALRQKHLLDIKSELEKRSLRRSAIEITKTDITSLLRKSSSSLITRALDSGKRIGAVKLPGFKGLLKREIQPGRTFGDEFSGRVRVIACIDQLPNIAVSEIPLDGLDDETWAKVGNKMDVSDADLIVLTWGPQQDLDTAMNEIEIRAGEAFDGVPNETRQHLKDYTTTFERILPGPDRMYPDTDSPPVAIKACTINEYEKTLPDKAYMLEDKWEKLGADPSIAKLAVVSNFRRLFDNIIGRQIIEPSRLYAVLKKASTGNNLDEFDYDMVAGILDVAGPLNLTNTELVKLLSESSRDTLHSNFESLIVRILFPKMTLFKR
jgi:glutamyl-tRNA(Gln) amidotransferase subunit E